MGSGAQPEATGRRDFLRKAAAVGTGAFAVPMIVTVDPADAQAITSPPPEPPGRGVEPVDSSGPTGTSESAGGAHPSGPTGTSESAGGAHPTARRTSGRSELPRTGADIDRMVAAGLAATAGGAALALWSAHVQPKADPATGTADATPEAEPET